MTALLKADMSSFILGEWRATKHPLLHQRRAVDTQWIVNAAFEHAPSQPETNAPSLTLNRDDTRRIIRAFFDWRRETERPLTQRDAQTRVTRVLQSLNEFPHLTALLPPTKTLYHRETVMPQKGVILERAEQVIALDRHLEAWAREFDTLDGWLLLFATRLMTRLGMGNAVLLCTLAQLTRLHVENEWLLIPAFPGADLAASSAHYRLKLPSALWRPLRAILTRWPGPADGWLFANDKRVVASDLSVRTRALTQRLQRATRVCLKAMSHHPRASEWMKQCTWPSLCQASRYVPVLQGTPSVYATLLKQYPLPTDTPMPLLAGPFACSASRIERDTSLSVDEGTSALPTLGHDTQPPGVRSLDTSLLPVDWPRQIKRLLQQFLADAQRLTQSKTVHAQKHEPSMRQLLTDYENQLVDMLPVAGSYSQWLLHWAYHLLRTKQHKLSSVRTYLSRLTPLPLLLNEGTLYLADWDDELVAELLAETLSEMSWKPATRNAFQQTFRQFLRFCQENGMLEDVSLPPTSQTHAVSTLRTKIMTPAHFHNLWHGLTQGAKAGEQRQLLALVIAMGFYGGLRASEILSLTLNDVVIDRLQDAPTCWIEILGGKTPAARRRVAFHVWAPPSVVDALSAWVTHRSALITRQQRRSDVALFGPTGDSNAFTRASLITPVIGWMRETVGPGVDFHGLRHAAVSWTLLRLHAAQTPGFAETLAHFPHWMFKPEGLEALLRHLCGAEGDDAIARGSLLYRLAKWIGHRDPGTLLQYYAHTLGLIHSDILSPKLNR
ncbi:site-specific integrase [Halomonas sp. NYA30]